MPVAQRITKVAFAMLVMVALLWASTMAITHVDGMSGQSGIVAAMDDTCCPDSEGGHGNKGVQHNCCMAHCMSMKASSPVLALVRVQPYATVIHTLADGKVVPNQFLKSLFRPPRTLA